MKETYEDLMGQYRFHNNLANNKQKADKLEKLNSITPETNQRQDWKYSDNDNAPYLKAYRY